MLVTGEVPVARTRAHAKALAPTALVLFLLAGLLGAVDVLVPRVAQPVGGWALNALLVVLTYLWVARPFLRWWSTTYTITTRRLLIQTGVTHRRLVEVPLEQVLDVGTRRRLVDRVLGCGDLLVANSTGRGTVLLRGVPSVEEVRQALVDLRTERSRPDRAPTAGQRR